MRDLCQFDLERWFGWSIITSLNLKMLCNKVLGPSFNWIQAREILVDENDRVAVHDPEYNCPLMEEHHRFLKPNNSVPKTLGPAHHLPNLHTHQTHHHTQHHQLIPHHHAHQPLFTSPSYMATVGSSLTSATWLSLPQPRRQFSCDTWHCPFHPGGILYGWRSNFSGCLSTGTCPRIGGKCGSTSSLRFVQIFLQSLSGVPSRQTVWIPQVIRLMRHSQLVGSISPLN